MYLINIINWFLPFIIPLISNYPEIEKFDIVAEFNSIDSTPQIVVFSNEFEINNIDGHLQGIQYYRNSSEYFYMSGSSDSYSYLALVKSGDKARVVSLNTLMEIPFKHAGGFQIFKNYLAVGIEDNSLKDKSKVCIYDISEPENPLNKPLAIIERNGEPLRSTAGCVGITNYKNKVLIAVGDWDTKHIDFYTSGHDKIVDSGFKKMASLDTEKISITGWINKEWLSYQNINIFEFENKLYLFGLGQNGKAENIVDLYEISEETSGHFSFIKLSSKSFACTEGCNFKAGAGVKFENEKIEILSCGYNISGVTHLNVFRSK